MRRRVLHLLPAWLACALALLSACDAGSSASSQSTPAPSGTSAATAPPSSQLTPATVPSGWLVYDGLHFAIAYPPDWSERTSQESGGPGTTTNYAFVAPSGSPEVVMHETDGVDAGAIRSVFCASTAGQTIVTVAGLPMRFSTPGSDGSTRIWEFITSQGTVYQLQAEDGTPGTASDVLHRTRLQDDGLLATFTPAFTTSACP
jgi:hypothetical protein